MRNSVTIQQFPDRIWLCYRRRCEINDETANPNLRYDVFCAAFGSEAEAIKLEHSATIRNYQILRESIPFLISDSSSSGVNQIYVVFQGGLEQDHPEALDFSDPVGIVAFQSKADSDSYISTSDQFDSGDVWEIKFPWISPYALSAFQLKRRMGQSENLRFSD